MIVGLLYCPKCKCAAVIPRSAGKWECDGCGKVGVRSDFVDNRKGLTAEIAAEEGARMKGRKALQKELRATQNKLVGYGTSIDRFEASLKGSQYADVKSLLYAASQLLGNAVEDLEDKFVSSLTHKDFEALERGSGEGRK